MIDIFVYRKKKSFDFKANPNLLDSFENNWKNNRLDNLYIYDGQNVVFACKAQTVANYCFGDNATADTVSFGDTVAPGKFKLKCFVPPRNFHGEIHAITETTDYDGQRINREAMQTTKGGFQNGRWLIHDMFSKKLGKDTNCAWSAGCFIMTSADLEKFNDTLRKYGVKPGDILDGTVDEADF